MLDQGAYAPKIPTYLWQSIVVTLLCCLPLGIPAIVYASQVDGKALRGDVEGALDCSRKAKNWCLAGLICGLLVLVIFILIYAGVFFAAVQRG